MWVAAALVAGGALLAVPQSADASVGPMIFPNTHWTVGNTSVSLQQDGKYDTFQYAGSRMYLSIYNQKTYKTTGSKYINVTFSNVASRTDANGHKVYVQRGYVTVAGKKVAVYRGVTKGYNGKLVVINGQMTTTKPNVKTLSALAYKQGAYYDATDRSGQWHLNESTLTVKASAKNATIYNSYNGGVASKLTGFAGKTYRSYSYVYGKTPAVYANAVGKYYTPVAKGKWQLESYYGLTYKTGNVYKYALVPSSKLVLKTSKTVAKESVNATMSYTQSQAADYAKAATSMVSYVLSAVKNGEHPASYGAWADSYASYANSLTGKNTDYTYAVSMAKKNGQNISSYTKAISASKTQTTNVVSKVKSLLANAKKYPVTIRYMYANGKSAGTDVKKSLYYADRLNFTIPAKAGYFTVVKYNNQLDLSSQKNTVYFNYTKGASTMDISYLPTTKGLYKKVDVKLPTSNGVYSRGGIGQTNNTITTVASAGSQGYLWYGATKSDAYRAEIEAETDFASVMSDAATNSYMSYTASQRSQFKSLASSASNQAIKTQSAYNSYSSSSQAAWNSQYGVSSSHSSVASSSVASSASVKPSSSSSAVSSSVSSSSVASSSVTSSSSVSSSSVANSSAVTSQWLNDLNALRAKERTPLTSDMVSDKGGAGSDEGKPLDALTQDAELTKWAQTRAEELAAQGSISHTDMKNGAPTWAVNSGQVDGGMFSSPAFDFSKQVNGPEALAMWSGGTQNPINMWASELQDGSQGYGHYLTEVSPFANKVGFGYAKTASGATIAVMEIGYHE